MEAIKVFLRVAPSSNEEKAIKIRKDDVLLQEVANSSDPRSFNFDRTFSAETTQIEVYDSTVRLLLADYFNGHNCNIIFYGQTGSGKSYSMGRNMSIELEEAGIIPRFFNEIFLTTENVENIEFTLNVSVFQVSKVYEN